ncbi:hypothetical protein KC19_3G086000 [Ceratodon purpureus]|uniref:Uncharacterized protein n=1 Tax=Ceratodon purpureus TaxID=3225 RepID=A0A8T0IIP2_CERPU|nr:hypothetical protein KC19_3G086000 [Ceratodon purpureus]
MFFLTLFAICFGEVELACCCDSVVDIYDLVWR